MANSDFYIQDNADIEVKKLDAAKELYQSGDYNGALRLYLDMLNSDYSHKLCYEIGRCYYRLNDFNNAELYFTRSISLEEYKNPSYTFLGNIYYKRQNISKAIENWITSYSYKPDDENVCLNIAAAYFSKNMKFYSMNFYRKYLKYAKDKSSAHYLEIKRNIDEYSSIADSLYQKAIKAIDLNDNSAAIQGLEYAANNFPVNFDINRLLGKLYLDEKNYTDSIKFLEQAFCIDNKSIDILKLLSTAMISAGEITGAYCCLKRMIPLVISRQKDYLDIVTKLKDFESRFTDTSCDKHFSLADKYFEDNNYHMALFEYENGILLNSTKSELYENVINRIKQILTPEERIIKLCFEKGSLYYQEKDYKRSNKYFTKIMTLSDENTSNYKLAKTRIVHV